MKKKQSKAEKIRLVKESITNGFERKLRKHRLYTKAVEYTTLNEYFYIEDGVFTPDEKFYHLSSMFIFSDTSEGHTYWWNKHELLNKES